ncbi:hypothetical protein DSO57_1009997 [Entomophthora muscae]|uniref:Uncharacterized protein n=1 Tax=Entomophthora muscae TaxID=34485 RepID=A0ACC2RLB6_9FUNG|nr:hypothetical protein DSO57_1009997 [Entomophthora muscae]
MTKASEAATILGGLFGFWLIVQLGWLPLPLPSILLQKVWPTLPFVALVWFGSYSFVNIGYNLMTFRDCPEAHEELMQQIDEALRDLRSKKINVD